MKDAKGNYIKVGRICQSTAKAAHIKAADIMIDNNHIKHIYNKHQAELIKLGFTPKELVLFIANSFNRIYKDKKTSALYLVVWSNDKTKTAVVELNYMGKQKFWEIKTAAPLRTAEFKTKASVWIKGAHPLK